MALLSSGKIQNFKASVEKYIQDNLSTTEGFIIHYEGLPFESAHNEWIEETILGVGDTEYVRGIGGSTNAMLVRPLINFNIYVKKQNTTKTNRHYEIRDILAGYFEIKDGINLYDFSTGDFTNSLQLMHVSEIVTDRPIPSSDFFQYNYSVAVEWRQEFT